MAKSSVNWKKRLEGREAGRFSAVSEAADKTPAREIGCEEKAVETKKNAKMLAPEVLRRMVVMAMLIAMYVVLDRIVPSIKLPGAKIALSFAAPIIAAALYGPVISMLVYGLGDLIAALLFPFGTYHPGFTVVAALMGIVLGLFLYKTPFDLFGSEKSWDKIRIFPNVIAPVLINALLGQFVNTLWVAQLYGSKTYWGWFVYRLPQHGFLIAAQIILIPLLLKLCETLKKAGLVSSKNNKKKAAKAK